MRPSTDAVLMIEPRSPSSMSGNAARHAQNTASRFVAIVRSQSSSVHSRRRPDICTAALLYRMSRRPNADAQAATIASTSSRTDTSAWIARAVPPADSTIDAAAAAPSSSMSAITIDAPCEAKSTAAARPCPDAAPVISATRPSSTERSVPDDGQRRRRTEPLAVDVWVVASVGVRIEAETGAPVEQGGHRRRHLHACEVHAEAHVGPDAEADVRDDRPVDVEVVAALPSRLVVVGGPDV